MHSLSIITDDHVRHFEYFGHGLIEEGAYEGSSKIGAEDAGYVSCHTLFLIASDLAGQLLHGGWTGGDEEPRRVTDAKVVQHTISV